MPIRFDVVILDRRDTLFPETDHEVLRIAIDNRGPARETADIVCDILPHYAMSDAAYRSALSAVLLPAALAAHASRTELAKITLCEERTEALRGADFPPQHRLSPRSYLAALAGCESAALYYGQSLFEALYLGKNVRLYPVSEYHNKLAVDLYSRLIIDPHLLSALDGKGLARLTGQIIAAIKGNHA